MKTDLATSIGASVLGVIFAFLICNMLLPAVEPVSFKKLTDSSNSYELVEPNPEVFNYRALNPTVEVYVGDCEEFDIYGNCLDGQNEPTETDEDNPDEVEDTLNDLEDTENSDEENPITPEPGQETENGSTN